MATIRCLKVEPAIIAGTQCDLDYACLSGQAVCTAEPFMVQDVNLLRCLEERDCPHRRSYRDRFICTCPVNRASFRLN